MGALMMMTCWRPPLEFLRKLLRRSLLSLALAPGKHFLLKAFLASPSQDFYDYAHAPAHMHPEQAV